MEGDWRPQSHSISWIAGANGEDGLLLEKGAPGKDYLVVEDVRSQNEEHTANGGKIASAQTLMKDRLTSHKMFTISLREAAGRSYIQRRVIVKVSLSVAQVT